MFWYKYKGARFTPYKILLVFITQRTSARRNYIMVLGGRLQEDLISCFCLRVRFILCLIAGLGTLAIVLGHFWAR